MNGFDFFDPVFRFFELVGCCLVVLVCSCIQNKIIRRSHLVA